MPATRRSRSSLAAASRRRRGGSPSRRSISYRVEAARSPTTSGRRASSSRRSKARSSRPRPTAPTPAPGCRIVVVDDNSSDGTGDIVRRLAVGDRRVQVLEGRPLPEGWMGKQNACAHGSQAAASEWLCFVDADTAARMQAALVSRFGLGARVPILRLKEEDEPLLRELADFVYRKAFLNYTTKQWGVKPEEISPEVTGRVPVVVDRDDRYFTDPYQAVPAGGYTKLFEKLLAHPNITVRVNTPFNAVGSFDPDTGAVQFEGAPFGGLLVFTGMVDELFGRDRGALPYRSIRFDFQHHAVPVFQPATTVNYPNEHRYTRITEFKHLTGQQCAGTSIVYEYPQAYDPADPEANVPYYPIFDERSKAAYTAYADRLGGHARVVAVGRLAQYRYFDMDDAVANALQVFDRIAAAQG